MLPDPTTLSFVNYLLETQGRTNALAALTNIQGGQYTLTTTSNGRILTTATATNKSFTYTLLPSMGPEKLMSMAFLAKQFIRSRTDAELDAIWSHRRSNVALGRFG